MCSYCPLFWWVLIGGAVLVSGHVVRRSGHHHSTAQHMHRMMRRQHQMERVLNQLLDTLQIGCTPQNDAAQTKEDTMLTALQQYNRALRRNSHKKHKRSTRNKFINNVSAQSFHPSCSDGTQNTSEHNDAIHMLFDNFSWFVDRHPVTSARLRLFKNSHHQARSRGQTDTSADTNIVQVTVMTPAISGQQQDGGDEHGSNREKRNMVLLDSKIVEINHSGWLEVDLKRAHVFRRAKNNSGDLYTAMADNSKLELFVTVEDAYKNRLPATQYIRPMNCSIEGINLVNVVPKMVQDTAFQQGTQIELQYLFPILDLQSITGALPTSTPAPPLCPPTHRTRASHHHHHHHHGRHSRHTHHTTHKH